MIDIQIGITSRVTGVARHLTQDIDSMFQREAFDLQKKNNTANMLMNRAKAIFCNSTLLLVMQ